jgi:hypothetical protein
MDQLINYKHKIDILISNNAFLTQLTQTIVAKKTLVNVIKKDTFRQKSSDVMIVTNTKQRKHPN